MEDTGRVSNFVFGLGSLGFIVIWGISLGMANIDEYYILLVLELLMFCWR